MMRPTLQLPLPYVRYRSRTQRWLTLHTLRRMAATTMTMTVMLAISRTSELEHRLRETNR